MTGFTTLRAQDLIRDAVVARDGVTYERRALRSWLASQSHSPVTLLPLPSKAVRANVCVRDLLEQLVRGYCAVMPSFTAGSLAQQHYLQEGGAGAVMAVLRAQLLCPLTMVRPHAALPNRAGGMGAQHGVHAQDIAEDAVMATVGYTYSRAAIAHWLASSSVSPVTRKPLRSKRLVPNRSYYSVLDWLARCEAAC